MSYAIVCPKCGRRYTLKESIAGKTVKCEKCGQAFQAPPPAAAEPPAAPAPASNFYDLLDEIPLEPSLPPPPAAVGPAAAVQPAAAVRPAAAPRTAAPPPPEGKILWATDKQWLESGIVATIIGVGSQILPHFGLQFARIARHGPHAVGVMGFLITLGGCAGLMIALRRRRAVALSAIGGVLAAFVIAYSLSPDRMADPQTVAELQAAASQALDGFNRIEQALGRVHDARSAQVALPALREAIDRLDAAARRVNELESKGVRLADGESYERQVDAISKRLTAQAERVTAIPGTEALSAELLRMASLGQGPAPAPASTPEAPPPRGPEAVARVPSTPPFRGPSRSRPPAVSPPPRRELPPSKPSQPESLSPELALPKPELREPEPPKPEPPKPQTFAGSRSGKTFESKAPEGGLLIGMQATHLKLGSSTVVKAIQPLYLVDGRRVPGARCGGGGQSKTVAKPGYAVGGMRARVGLAVNGVQFVYMRIKNKQLDPKDAYDSEWLGSNQGGSELTSIGKGQPLVGVFGSHANFVTGLGFLVMQPASKRAASAPPLGRSKLLGSPGNTAFEDAASEGGLLVGAQAEHVDFGRTPILESLQPIYLVGEGQVRGKRCGYDPGTSRSIAKEGYAVGAIKVSTGLGVNGLQLVYMRTSGTRLDPQDSYESEVLGGSEGGDPITLGGDGRPLAGLQGTYDKMLNGLGLLDAAP
jgi:predicted Zn finger-like uncharacterized protein